MPPRCPLSRAALSGAELRDAGAAAASPMEPGWAPGVAAPASPRPAEGPGNGRKEKFEGGERRGAGRVRAPPGGAAEPRRYLPRRRAPAAGMGLSGEPSSPGSRAARGAEEGGPEPAALPRPPPLPAPARCSALLPRREKGQRCPNKAIGSQELLPKITPRSPASARGPFYEGGKRHSPPSRPSVRPSPPRPGQGSRRRTGWESKRLLKIERAWEGGASLPPRCPAGRTGSRPGTGGSGRGSREPRPGAMSRAERSRGAAPGLLAPAELEQGVRAQLHLRYSARPAQPGRCFKVNFRGAVGYRKGFTRRHSLLSQTTNSPRSPAV